MAINQIIAKFWGDRQDSNLRYTRTTIWRVRPLHHRHHVKLFLCSEQDLNLHATNFAYPPQRYVSPNSTT